MFEAEDFYREIRKRNKAKFISVVTKQIEKENAKNGNSVNIPEFLEAEATYEDFKRADAFDCYGFLKPIAG